MGFHKLICYADTIYSLRRKEIKWHQIFIIVDLLRCPLSRTMKCKNDRNIRCQQRFLQSKSFIFLGAKKAYYSIKGVLLSFQCMQ